MVKIIKESLYFSFNNQLSSIYNILNISISSGLAEEELIAETSILETTIRGRSKPYYTEKKKSPKTIKITAAFEDTWDEDSLSTVEQWLFDLDFYAPLIFSEMPNRIFYAMPIGSVQIFHNYLSQGYFTVEFRCSDFYSYSPEYTSVYDLTTNPTTTTISINNLGHTICYPLISIEKSGTGVFQINNLSDANREFKFTSITDGRAVDIYNEEEIIESSQTGEYLYDQFNDTYLYLTKGVNQLQITGTGIITFIYQFKFL